MTAPSGETFQTCRVFSGPDGTQVWWWDPALRDARVVLSSPFGLEQISAGSRHYQLPTDEGEAHVARSHSCGCGHPMKRWQLPKPVREGA